MKRTLEQRLVGKSNPVGDCLVWTSTKYSNGYGQIKINYRKELAHRVAWKVYFGDIPSGLFVLHHCDNRPCIKKEHLFLGTNLDNVRDMISKGRNSPPPHRRGAECGSSKLTEESVFAIRASKGSHSQLAKAYGVSDSLIGAIKGRKIWTHI